MRGAVAAGALWVCACCAFGCSASVPRGAAAADGLRREAPALSRMEREELLAGRGVSRRLSFDRGRAGYVGGVSYQVVRASPDAVLSAIGNAENWPAAFPSTQRAELVGFADGRAYVELEQGGSFVRATYTIAVERTAEHGVLRFWLDTARPHDIRDVWGFFRATPLEDGRSLVTVAVALDLGPGVFQSLFEERVANVMLRSPQSIRDFVEPRVLAFLR